jgi:hypothetical protein
MLQVFFKEKIFLAATNYHKPLGQLVGGLSQEVRLQKREELQTASILKGEDS